MPSDSRPLHRRVSLCRPRHCNCGRAGRSGCPTRASGPDKADDDSSAVLQRRDSGFAARSKLPIRRAPPAMVRLPAAATANGIHHPHPQRTESQPTRHTRARHLRGRDARSARGDGRDPTPSRAASRSSSANRITRAISSTGCRRLTIRTGSSSMPAPTRIHRSRSTTRSASIKAPVDRGASLERVRTRGIPSSFDDIGRSRRA